MKTHTYYVLRHALIGRFVEISPADLVTTVGTVEQATPFPTISEVFDLISRRADKFGQSADLGFELHRVTTEVTEVPKVVSVVQL